MRRLLKDLRDGVSSYTIVISAVVPVLVRTVKGGGRRRLSDA